MIKERIVIGSSIMSTNQEEEDVIGWHNTWKPITIMHGFKDQKHGTVYYLLFEHDSLSD